MQVVLNLSILFNSLFCLAIPVLSNLILKTTIYNYSNLSSINEVRLTYSVLTKSRAILRLTQADINPGTINLFFLSYLY